MRFTLSISIALLASLTLAGCKQSEDPPSSDAPPEISAVTQPTPGPSDLSDPAEPERAEAALSVEAARLPLRPRITAFVASPGTITAGAATTLSWNVANATSIRLDNGIGAVTGTSRSVTPTQTTSYTLTATNSRGSVTATTTVAVNTAPTQVALSWNQPASGAQISGNATLHLIGQAFENVEIFRNGTMIARAVVAADKTSATATIDTTQFANGPLTLTAHAWNSPPGAAFTSDADAGALTLTVQNGTTQPAAFWFSGTDGLSRDFHNSFGAWRGRPSTSTWINLLWLPWDWLTGPGLWSTNNNSSPNVRVWDLYRDFPGIVVLSMSMAGNGNVDRAAYENNMRACAGGAYNGYWETFGANAAAAGRTGANTVVSIAQEFNGTWFKWNPKNVGLTVWLDCWRNVYTSIHKHSSVKVAWVFSATTVTSSAGADWAVNNVWEAYPGDQFVDVIGVNRYDFKMFGPSTTNWRDHCWNRQDICYAAQYAREHGKPLGIAEWGPDREKGYADNAEFISMMYGFFNDNRDVLLFETTFNTILGGTPGWWHIYPESSINAKASARYKQLWRSAQ
jgi:hypothetical protein